MLIMIEGLRGKNKTEGNISVYTVKLIGAGYVIFSVMIYASLFK